MCSQAVLSDSVLPGSDSDHSCFRLLSISTAGCSFVCSHSLGRMTISVELRQQIGGMSHDTNFLLICVCVFSVQLCDVCGCFLSYNPVK